MLDLLHIRLLTYRFVTVTPDGWRFPHVQSHFWRLYVNNRDGAFLTQTGTTVHLQQDRLYFVPAGVRFSTDTTQNVGHFFVHFDVIGLSYLVRREIFAEPILVPYKASVEETVKELIAQADQGSTLDLIQQCRVKVILYDGLALYLRSLPDDLVARCVQRAAVPPPVQPAIQYIETNLARAVSNTELARQCHMSTDYFIRRFRECMGQTPGEYLREQRIKQAEQHLLLTDQSIDRIADVTGFGNRFYFSRVFARHTGTSPAAYRAGWRGE